MVLHRFHRCRLAMHPAIATWSEHPPRPHLSMAKNSWPESKWHFSAFLKVKVHNYIHSGNNARGEFVLKTPFFCLQIIASQAFLIDLSAPETETQRNLMEPWFWSWITSTNWVYTNPTTERSISYFFHSLGCRWSDLYWDHFQLVEVIQVLSLGTIRFICVSVSGVCDIEPLLQ